MFDLRYLTIHTILAHHKHEEPTYREFKLMEQNPIIYYSVKFLYDNDFLNTSYSDIINKKITDAIFRCEPTIEIEFNENGIRKQHLINLHTMKIINISTDCFNCFEPEEIYELVVCINKETIYRSVLINNCSDTTYPLRTEYFKYICDLHDK
jgi:hypothetical protein